MAFWDYLGSRLSVPGPAPHSAVAGPCPLPRAARLIPAAARGFAPITKSPQAAVIRRVSSTKLSCRSAVPAIHMATGILLCDPLPHILRLCETFRPCSRADPAEDASGQAAPIAAAAKWDCPAVHLPPLTRPAHLPPFTRPAHLPPFTRPAHLPPFSCPPYPSAPFTQRLAPADDRAAATALPPRRPAVAC